MSPDQSSPADLLVPQPTAADFPEFVSIPVRVARNAARWPDKTAVKCGDERRSWRDFDRRVDKVACALTGMGIGKGDKIAILAANSIEYLETFMGGLRAGACVVPLSTMAAADALEKMLDDCDAKLLFLSDRYRALVEPYEERLGKLVPGGRIAYDFERQGWHGFERWLAPAGETAFDLPIDPLDDFNIIYSSGTTGLPKGILHSHAMRDILAVRFQAFDYGPDTISLASTPLYSNTTLVAVLATIGIGGTTILMPKFDAVQFLEIAERERVTHAMLVPVQYQRLLAHPDFGKYDLGAFKAKLSTSAPLRAEVKAECLKRWPGRLIEIYGLTEGGGSCTLEANLHPDKLHTVGKPGLGSEIVVLDEQGRVLPQGEVGELAGRAQLMMKGYYKQSDKTRDLFWHDKDGRLFFRSGDMGRIDEDGFVVLLDRKKDMIISGGFNVYAADIEVLLLKHPDVVDAAVIGVPSEQWGESPMALCVRRESAAATEDEIKDWANGQLSKTQRLVAVEFREELPRSTIGKIMKRELREPYWAGRSARI
ncbi:class I adenylate-forming enzyme family protein [Enhydrobacter sp.]|jgi:acyl-CoA synthetase (AMP-forming)/AMP-acid ligase II|uniref:class I adenylate-forming enzyme family protein n=1 Tax=Enhydrobacter sp. TaxID=1894999 RepID=UPI00260C20F8|nr:class I adenylate-forming enzyme family protein [Enhydrobacter sp.]WIM13172.1 MAG: Long-chain-fatty-acid--CoA ligase [Enhydrobacter sp.]